MRLASEEITITIGGEVIRLRPTLRAAARLERRYGGFDAIVRGIADGNASVVADVISEGAGGRTAAIEHIRALMRGGMHFTMTCLSEPLADFVLALAGADPESEQKQEAVAGERISFADYHAKLFRIATGWIGWPPETAWDSTPAEIIAAYQGRVEMLRAIFGGEDQGEQGPVTHTEDQVRAGIATLKAMAATGGNRGV